VWSGLTPQEVQTGFFCWPLATQANSRRHQRTKPLGRDLPLSDASLTLPPSGPAPGPPCALRFRR
jgi:hypothetical protein